MSKISQKSADLINTFGVASIALGLEENEHNLSAYDVALENLSVLVSGLEEAKKSPIHLEVVRYQGRQSGFTKEKANRYRIILHGLGDSFRWISGSYGESENATNKIIAEWVGLLGCSVRRFTETVTNKTEIKEDHA